MDAITLSPAQKAWQTRRARAAGTQVAIAGAAKRQDVALSRPPHHGLSIGEFAGRIVSELSARELAELRAALGIRGEVKPARAPRLFHAPTYSDYLMPRLYTPALRDWPSYVLTILFDDDRCVSASFASKPGNPINVGHALRIVAGFYRARSDVHKQHAFIDEKLPNSCIKYTNRDRAIPLPGIKWAKVTNAVTRQDMPEEGLLEALAAAMVPR